MKSKIIKLLAIGMLATASSTYATDIEIPDPIFKAYLVGNPSINTNGDGEISLDEALAYTGGINVSGMGISDLTGIEEFRYFTSLDCSYNNLSGIDFGDHYYLWDIDCSFNPSLEYISSIPTSVYNLYCNNTNLLTLFPTYGNDYSLIIIDISNTPCTETGLQNNNFPNLNKLYANYTDLTSIDLSNISSLTHIYLNNNNNLSSVNIANGNNYSIIDYSSVDNPLLECIQIDAGITPSPSFWHKDPSAVYGTVCTTCMGVVSIPDVNFLNGLLAHGVSITGEGIGIIDTNGDGLIQKCEANAYTGNINVSGLGISNLNGIDKFINVNDINCSNNNLTALDLSQNFELHSLFASNNNLTNVIFPDWHYSDVYSVDLSNNNLTSFSLSDIPVANIININNNEIATLNPSINGNLLMIFSCNNNFITDLNLLNSNYLAWVEAYNNSISSVQINSNVQTLRVNNNAINSISLSALTQLANFDISDNPIINIDASNCTSLEFFYASNNPNLSNLNIANGNNTSILGFAATDNSSLFCIQIDPGFTPTLSWLKDGIASYSNDCNAWCNTLVNIPDANFKNALLAHGTTITGTDINVIDVNGDGEIQNCEAIAYTGKINVANKSIMDMTGIEAFVNATKLDCSMNSIAILNVDALTHLNGLWCYENNITSLNLANNPELITLSCGDNALTSLDVSNQVALIDLACQNNNIGAMDVVNNTLLEMLDISGNSFTTIDISSNTALKAVSCYNNNLSELITTNNPLLEYIYCYNNPITALSLVNNTSLIMLLANNTQIESIDLTVNNDLEEIVLNDNPLLTSINVANGNNNNITLFNATVSPLVRCITIDEGFGPTAGWSKDATAFYSNEVVNIPDAALRNALLAHGITITGPGISLIDLNTNGMIEKCEAEAYTGTIDVSNLGIADLTGLEAFPNITVLNAEQNFINVFNFGDIMGDLRDLNLWDNDLDEFEIDLGEYVELENLNVGKNNLTVIDGLVNLFDIQMLNVEDNQLTSLDLSSNINLRDLNCSKNKISELNLANNTKLESIQSTNTRISFIDLSAQGLLTQAVLKDNDSLEVINMANGENASMSNFDATNSPRLYCIQIDTGFTPSPSKWKKPATASYNVACVLSIQNHTLTNVSLFPNPTSGLIQIKADVVINRITVMDQLGKEVASIEHQNNIDISHLSNGLYYITITAKEGTFTSKVVKQ